MQHIKPYWSRVHHHSKAQHRRGETRKKSENEALISVCFGVISAERVEVACCQWSGRAFPRWWEAQIAVSIKSCGRWIVSSWAVAVKSDIKWHQCFLPGTIQCAVRYRSGGLQDGTYPLSYNVNITSITYWDVLLDYNFHIIVILSFFSDKNTIISDKTSD